jgi:RHS repeat-associated protein
LITDYTFGNDEILQRVHGTKADGTSVDDTLIFGHDGHGSVRYLSGLAGVINQVATYAAYGAVIAVHNAIAQLVGTSESSFKSTLGYSGEAWDTNVQQQYLRARFYNPDTGRFDRSDDFSGNKQDPQSLHKYAYVHGDPIGMTDPTGLFGLAGLSISMEISSTLQNMNINVAGAALSAAFTAKAAHDAGGSFSLEFFNAFRGNIHTSAVESLISAIPVVGTIYDLYQVGMLTYDVVAYLYSDADIDAALAAPSSYEAGQTSSSTASSEIANMKLPPAASAGGGLKQLLLFPVRTDMFKSTDDWIQWLTNRSRQHHKEGLGEVEKAHQPFDPAAEKLSQRLGGTAQAKFAWGNTNDEFDTISDQYVAQSKPANFRANPEFRRQARRTFEQAIQSGRKPYFHFDGPPHRDTLSVIQRYSKEYKITAVVDTAPL